MKLAIKPSEWKKIWLEYEIRLNNEKGPTPSWNKRKKWIQEIVMKMLYRKATKNERL